MWNSSHRIPPECWQKMSYNQSCKKNHHVTLWGKRKIKEIRMGPVGLGRSCAREMFFLPSHPGSLLQWMGNQLKQLGKLRGPEESAAASLQQARQTEGDQHRGSLPTHCTSKTKIHTCWGTQQLDAKTCTSVNRSGGEDLVWLCRDNPKGLEDMETA